MASVTIEEAQAKLPQLIEAMNSGEEVVITKGGQPWAQVAPATKEIAPAELAAWTSVARTILNLHETITRN